MKQRIIHIAFSGLGGTTDYVFNLISADIQKKYSHVILFFGTEQITAKQLKRGKDLSFECECIQKKKGVDLYAFKKLTQFIEKHNPLYITLHINSLMLPLYLNGYGKKTIFVEHQPNHQKTKKEWIWSRLAQQKSKKVVCLTSAHQKEIKETIKAAYKAKNNCIIPTGIPIETYQKNSNSASSKLKIGMIGRINSLKDQETLLKAFHLLTNPDIELHIAGDGDLLGTLKSQYQKENIIFHGMIPATTIPNFLAELDIYVHATKGETSSVSIMQAQASGLPIIASDVKGVNNILNSQNAILTPVGDAISIKNSLELIIHNKEKLTQLANASKEYADKHLSHIKMFEKYDHLFTELDAS